MTLEGEYYKIYRNGCDTAKTVAILMTLEGEYYWAGTIPFSCLKTVAILMTLEGEYYTTRKVTYRKLFESRNPHDIGRRILQNTFTDLPL